MGHANTNNTGSSKLLNEDLRTLNIKIDKTRYTKLVAHANTKDMSTTGFARKLIEDYIDNQVSPFEGS